jgi:hypothetical protein
MEMMKYLMIIDHYNLPYRIDEFIHNKKYRQDSIKEGGLCKYLKIFLTENIAEKYINNFNEYWGRISGLKSLLKKPNDNKKKQRKWLSI